MKTTPTTTPPMTPATALKVLVAHNKWRRNLRDEFTPSQSPKDIGEAIDAAIKALKRQIA